MQYLRIGPPWARIELRVRDEKLISGVDYLFGNVEGNKTDNDNIIAIEVLGADSDVETIKGEITGFDTPGQALINGKYYAYESDWAGIYDTDAREGKVAINEGNFTGFDTFLRQIAIYHSYENGYLPLHSVAFEYHGKTYICPGESDSGKSTIAGLIKDEAEVYSDEINVIGGEPMQVWPLPFRGTSQNKIGTGGGILSAVLIHRKATKASTEEISRKAALRDIEKSVILPTFADSNTKNRAFTLLTDYLLTADIYILNFPKNSRGIINAITSI